MSISNTRRELRERELLSRPVAGLQYMLGVLAGMLLALPCRITMGKRTWLGLAAFSPTPLSGGAYEALISASLSDGAAARVRRKGRFLC